MKTSRLPFGALAVLIANFGLVACTRLRIHQPPYPSAQAAEYQRLTTDWAVRDAAPPISANAHRRVRGRGMESWIMAPVGSSAGHTNATWTVSLHQAIRCSRILDFTSIS